MICIDQAHHLRLLALSAGPRRSSKRGTTRWLAVAGGKGGVGTTTIALNLAATFARRGQATVLVDADPDASDIAVMCRLAPRTTQAHMPDGQLDSPHSLVLGPVRLEILCGQSSRQRLPLPGHTRSRLLGYLIEKTPPPDWVVLDLGDRFIPGEHSLWAAADLLLLVTTPELPAILDTYASLKTLFAHGVLQPIWVVVNAADSERQANEVYRRLERACWRFLGCRLEPAGWVARDRVVRAAVAASLPLTIKAPRSRPARQLEHVASRLLSIPCRTPAPLADGVFSEALGTAAAARASLKQENDSSQA